MGGPLSLRLACTRVRYGFTTNRVIARCLPKVMRAGSARFSPDGKLLYCLMGHDLSSSSSELWRKDLETGKSEALLPGLSMAEYDVSDDGKQVVFSTQPSGKPSQLWLAELDGR